MPSPLRFAVIKKQFEEAGWQLVRIRGSHHIFSKPGKVSYPVPVHGGKVKAAYVQKIEKLLEEG